MIISSSDRVIHTGMYTKKAHDVMDAVFGQLSDGWGENNPRNDRYWKFGGVAQEVDGEVTIHISSKTSEYYAKKFTPNGFNGMDDSSIKSWMARMIKKTIMMELKDNQLTAKDWKRNNTSFTTCYLNRDEDINVAEVYCIYELLLGRNVGITHYDVSVINAVLGSKRQPYEIEAEVKKRDIAKAIDDEYAAKVKFLYDDEKRKVDELTARIAEIKKLFADKRQEAWHEKMAKLKTIA